MIFVFSLLSREALINIVAMMMMMMVSDLSREVEMALTSRWQAVVGDEFDIIVSICLHFLPLLHKTQKISHDGA